MSSENATDKLIRLDEYGIEWAKSVGYFRHHESEKKGRKQSDGSNAANALSNHQRGAAGELALSRYLGELWQAPVNTFNRFPDLDGYLECRAKQEKQAYLRLYPGRDDDKDPSLFVSVTVNKDLSEVRVDGWIIGKTAMQDCYLENSEWSNRKEWHIPISQLQPAETLHAEVEKRLQVLTEGRKRMREWVRGTMQQRSLL